MLSRRILVVDDNVDLSRGIAMLLQCWGHEVYTAYDGRTALAMARTMRFDLLLLDIGLPGIDGFELAAALRREGLGAKIISMTGTVRETDGDDSVRSGIDHHVIKPLDVGFLRSLLGWCRPSPAAPA